MCIKTTTKTGVATGTTLTKTRTTTRKMGEKFDVDETSNLKEENVKVPPRDEPTLKEKLKVSKEY